MAVKREYDDTVEVQANSSREIELENVEGVLAKLDITATSITSHETKIERYNEYDDTYTEVEGSPVTQSSAGNYVFTFAGLGDGVRITFTDTSGITGDISYSIELHDEQSAFEVDKNNPGIKEAARTIEVNEDIIDSNGRRIPSTSISEKRPNQRELISNGGPGHFTIRTSVDGVNSGIFRYTGDTGVYNIGGGGGGDGGFFTETATTPTNLVSLAFGDYDPGADVNYAINKLESLNVNLSPVYTTSFSVIREIKLNTSTPFRSARTFRATNRVSITSQGVYTFGATTATDTASFVGGVPRLQFNDLNSYTGFILPNTSNAGFTAKVSLNYIFTSVAWGAAGILSIGTVTPNNNYVTQID